MRIFLLPPASDHCEWHTPVILHGKFFSTLHLPTRTDFFEIDQTTLCSYNYSGSASDFRRRKIILHFERKTTKIGFNFFRFSPALQNSFRTGAAPAAGGVYFQGFNNFLPNIGLVPTSRSLNPRSRF